MKGFLAGRSAASEGAFFFDASKHAIGRLKNQNQNQNQHQNHPPQIPTPSSPSSPSQADVLPEILRHSLPLSTAGSPPSSFSPTPSSLASIASSSSSSPSLISKSQQFNATNPLGDFLPSLPQASFGPRRWQPSGDGVNVFHSTANEANMEGRSAIDNAKAEALVEGYSEIVKAFLVATALLMGGVTLIAGVVAAKLDIHSIDDIRIKGQEHMRSQVHGIHRSFEPWKLWAQQKNKQWNMDDDRRNVISAGVVESLGLKQLLKDEGNE